MRTGIFLVQSGHGLKSVMHLMSVWAMVYPWCLTSSSTRLENSNTAISAQFFISAQFLSNVLGGENLVPDVHQNVGWRSLVRSRCSIKRLASLGTLLRSGTTLFLMPSRLSLECPRTRSTTWIVSLAKARQSPPPGRSFRYLSTSWSSFLDRKKKEWRERIEGMSQERLVRRVFEVDVCDSHRMTSCSHSHCGLFRLGMFAHAHQQDLPHEQ